MNRLRLLFLSFVMMFTLTGCTDPVADAWAWISELLSTFMTDIACYLYQAYIYVAGLLITIFHTFVMPLISALPVWDPPSVSLASSPYMQFAAYILPISEAAYLMEMLLIFYTGFYGLRFILRWLKVIR